MDIRTLIANRLAELGWTALGQGHTAVATKTVETAVGPKEAQVYLASIGGSTLITGDYQSEGRNILEGHPVPLPKDPTPAAIRQRVDAFDIAVDKAIGDSYAVRLLRAA